MIKEFVLAWEKNKGVLEEYFRTHVMGEYSEYKDLVVLLFDKVINPELNDPSHIWNKKRGTYDTEEITVVDNGDYQGTLIFLLHKCTYQPNTAEYVYTNTYYGSCGGCDTLMGIMDDGGGYNQLPDDQQVKDLMMLCLHLLQKCVPMRDGEEE